MAKKWKSGTNVRGVAKMWLKPSGEEVAKQRQTNGGAVAN